MTTRALIRVASRAAAQIRSASDWWSNEHGGDSQALSQELENAFLLLIRHPDAGARATDVALQGVRRVLLRRTQFWLYYELLHEPEARVVHVLALWHTRRGKEPKL